MTSYWPFESLSLWKIKVVGEEKIVISEIRTEVILNQNGVTELREWNSGRKTYQCWQMPIEEVEELASWWISTGQSYKESQAPIKNFNTGRLMISMFTPSLIHVKGFDNFGKSRMIGYTLPRSLVESVANWMFKIDSRVESLK